MVTSENPNAVYMIVEHRARILDWKGIRVYLGMKKYVIGLQNTYKNQVAKIVGKQPQADFGQGWERAI
jgi:hypothetical protein